MEVKYIGFYNLPESNISRAANLAAINKIDYIMESLNQAGFDVHFISPSWILNSHYSIKYYPKTSLKIDNHKRITFCPSVATKYRFGLYLTICFSMTWLFFWMVTYVKRDEKILVYHSPWLSIPIRLAKWIVGFEVILEVEEIYSMVWQIKKILAKWENKLLSKDQNDTL